MLPSDEVVCPRVSPRGYLDGPNPYAGWFVPHWVDPTGMNLVKKYLVRDMAPDTGQSPDKVIAEVTLTMNVIARGCSAVCGKCLGNVVVAIGYRWDSKTEGIQQFTGKGSGTNPLGDRDNRIYISDGKGGYTFLSIIWVGKTDDSGTRIGKDSSYVWGIPYPFVVGAASCAGGRVSGRMFLVGGGLTHKDFMTQEKNDQQAWLTGSSTFYIDYDVSVEKCGQITAENVSLLPHNKVWVGKNRKHGIVEEIK